MFRYWAADGGFRRSLPVAVIFIFHPSCRSGMLGKTGSSRNCGISSRPGCALPLSLCRLIETNRRSSAIDPDLLRHWENWESTGPPAAAELEDVADSIGEETPYGWPIQQEYQVTLD
jgi:hypothetical protein